MALTETLRLTFSNGEKRWRPVGPAPFLASLPHLQSQYLAPQRCNTIAGAAPNPFSVASQQQRSLRGLHLLTIYTHRVVSSSPPTGKMKERQKMIHAM